MAPGSAIGRRAAITGLVTMTTAAVTANERKAIAQEAQGAPVAVELFTSQGCSSCPPADAVLAELASRPDFVALSFHVDYWNYIGWKDPFSSAQMTDRQRAYARALSQSSVYTPEMVVGGLGHTPGIYKDKLNVLIQRARLAPGSKVTPALSIRNEDTLSIGLADLALDTRSADVLLALYDREHQTPVARGENEGRTLRNINVVRRFEKIAIWDGTRASWSIRGVELSSAQGVAILVQRPNNGPIITCAKLEPRRLI